VSTLLIGLDIGTTSVKAGLFDATGRLLAVAAAPQPLHAPVPGWAEQDPADWWAGSCQVLKRILEGIDVSRVGALGLSGQCPGHVLVDPNGQPLGPAIIWRDLRAQAEAAWIASRVSRKQALEWLGTEPPTDAGAPPARLVWLARHRPAEWAAARTVLQPKDFIALCLTGECATDRHSAYCLAHASTGAYAPDYFADLGLPVDKMPVVLEPTRVVGQVSQAAARATGLLEGTPLVCGTIDAYCDNLAGGLLLERRAVDVAGTSEILSLGTSGRVEAAGVFPAEVGGAPFLCGPTQAGGDTLRWLADGFYPEFGGRTDFARLEAEAAAIPPGSQGLVFLPYLSGERAPLWDAQARAAFYGLTMRHDRRHMTRAVYEGVAFAVRHILETAESACGEKALELVVCGGGSQSQFWNQVKADVLGRPVHPTQVTQSGCLGAAILAAVGAGLQPDLRRACQTMILFQAPVAPHPELAEVYAHNYQVYLRLYPALKMVEPLP